MIKLKFENIKVTDENLIIPLTKEKYNGDKASFIIISGFGPEVLKIKDTGDQDVDTKKRLEAENLDTLVEKLKKTDSNRSIFYLKPPQKLPSSILELAKLNTDEILNNSDIHNCGRFVLFAPPSLLAGPVGHEMSKLLEKKGRNISYVIFECDLDKNLKSNEENTSLISHYEPTEKIKNLIILSAEKEKHDDKNLGWGKYSEKISLKTVKGSYFACLSNVVSARELAKSLSAEITLIEIMEALEIICDSISISSSSYVGYTKKKETESNNIKNCFNILLQPFQTALTQLQEIKGYKENSNAPFQEVTSPRQLPDLEVVRNFAWYVVQQIQENAPLLDASLHSITSPLFEDGESMVMLIESTILEICNIYNTIVDECIEESKKSSHKINYN